jgi:hypothetical protein
MQDTDAFRCPFEAQGQQEDTIVKVNLSEDKEDRLVAMAAAFLQFYCRDECVAIRFTLPPSILGCSTFQELKKALLPYQSEVHAALLDYRLRPLLAYDLHNPASQLFTESAKADKKRLAAASVLLAKVKELGIRTPKNMLEQAMWIETHFRLWMHRGLDNPGENMELKVGNQTFNILTMEPASIRFHLDREFPDDPKTNKNCFSIVKCPLYPREFGRFSEDVEIVISREADFAPLNHEFRKRIRVRSNTVLRAHGVHIRSLEDDIQPIGLWIPEFVR